MRFSRSLARTAAAALTLAVAFPVVAAANPARHDDRQHQRMDPEQRAQFVRRHLDREASMLEIKASQQAAWDAYAAARLDLMASFDKMKPPAADADAATIARQRADRAEAAAQGLAKVADATARLQATLGDEQRKVFDRLARGHWHGHDGHHPFDMNGQRPHGPASGPGMPKSPATPAAPAGAAG
jgi:hypothetical protein